MADSQAESPKKAPHRSVYMGEDQGRAGETVQTLKGNSDELFATEGWKELTFEEAKKAFEEKGSLFGVYDPMETVYSKGNSSTSARIIVKFAGRNSPPDFNHFKTIKYYLEETE